MKKLIFSFLVALPLLAAAEVIYWGDSTGTRAEITRANPLPVSTFNEFYLEVSRQNAPGITHVNKFGFNDDVDKGAAEDIWDGGGTYTPPTQDRTHQIASSSAQDAGSLAESGTIGSGSGITTLIDSSATFVTNSVAVGDVVLDDTRQDHSLVVSIDSETQLTIKPWHHVSFSSSNTYNPSGNTYRIVSVDGTGAAVAHILFGVQEDGTQLTEFVILNGTDDVATTNEYFRIDRMHMHGAGSNGTNVGTITATANTDSTVTAQINANKGQTQMAFLHVARGKYMYISQWCATLFRTGSASQAMAQLSLKSRLWGDDADGELLRAVMGISVDGGTGCHQFSPYLRIRQDEDIWIKADDVSDNNSQISAWFDAFMVSQ